MPAFTELTVQLGLGDNDEKGDDLHRERGELRTGRAWGGALEPGVEVQEPLLITGRLG